MGPRKSQFDITVDLFTAMIRRDPLSVTSSKHLRADIATLEWRSLHEGMSFLTKSLPRLGKALDGGLEESRFTIPGDFGSSHRNRSVPAFMQTYFNLVFDEEGFLRDDCPPEAVKHLRQICYFAYKLESPYDKATEETVITSFVDTDAELSSLVVPGSSEDSSPLEVSRLRQIQLITKDVFDGLDPRDIVPRHGPGAVATGEKLESKWTFVRKYSGIHSVYPYYDYFVVGGAREIGDRLRWYRSLIPLDEGCAKVVLVPKDSRGPRLISCEPLEYQFIQQGLGRKLMSWLEASPLTAGRVNFTHQTINRDLALSSSQTREWATLDLKDASDRVSLDLVRKVFHLTDLTKFLEACRSHKTLLPDGREVTLNKFAPMGSALCFPVEAYCFWVIVVATLVSHGLPLRRAAQLVKVYGDDIVVPTEYAELSIQCLEEHGLRVNRAKCCIKGFFRESCGMDAFKGVCVTPQRMRKPWTSRSVDGTAYTAYVSLANSLQREGYEEAALLLWKELEEVYGTIPVGLETSPFPCRIVKCYDYAVRYNRKRFRTRFNRQYQKIEFRVKNLRAEVRDSVLDDWPRALRGLVSPVFGDPSKVSVPRLTSVGSGWRGV